MRIQESAEDYLETILILSRRQQQVRSIDIVNEMNFSKPSVSIAMKNLREKGQIQMDSDGYITLTEEGHKIASQIYERHLLISKLLMQIGVEEQTALEEACRIEHDISQDTFEKLKGWAAQQSF
ncbi:MAG: metal-dependent transcriptional regulator [Lachnospiraceae bacterium]|nr:metal-dependent transcriptional regulator [Lachnospiraceae bacterium]